MAPRVVADGRQPAKLHGEHLHQHHAERERGKRDARYGERHADAIGPPIAPHRGRDADRHADQPPTTPCCHKRQPERRHEAIGDLGRHRPLACESTCRSRQRSDAARRSRTNCCGSGRSSPRSLRTSSTVSRRRVGARGEARRIARQHVDEQENQQADEQQRRQQAEQALERCTEASQPPARALGLASVYAESEGPPRAFRADFYPRPYRASIILANEERNLARSISDRSH